MGMSGKWTPGPWRVQSTEADDGVSFIYSGAPGDVYCIARMMRFTGGPSSDSANAALVAAAPDLYAALDALIDGRNWVMSTEKFLAAKAALSKARGETK